MDVVVGVAVAVGGGRGGGGGLGGGGGRGRGRGGGRYVGRELCAQRTDLLLLRLPGSVLYPRIR